MNIKHIWLVIMEVLSGLQIGGCANTAPQSMPTANLSAVTLAQKTEGISYGLIKRDLTIGVSNQADVIRKFGSPNNMVFQGKDRGELWIYDQVQTESVSQSDSNSSGVAVGGLSGGSGGALGANIGARNAQSTNRVRSSVRTLTVILDFDGKGILIDISARQGGY